MLEAHFSAAFECVRASALSASGYSVTDFAAVASQRAYFAIWRAEATAFDLKPKDRLALEVPELKAWVLCRKEFVRKRQAELLAEAAGMAQVALGIHDSMAADARTLLALQEVAVKGPSCALKRWVEEHWGAVP